MGGGKGRTEEESEDKRNLLDPNGSFFNIGLLILLQGQDCDRYLLKILFLEYKPYVHTKEGEIKLSILKGCVFS